MNDLDGKVVRSTAWVALSYGGSQLSWFVVMALLAHLLSPHAFGVVSLAGVIVLALSYLQESGLSAATIQRREGDLATAAGTLLVFSFATSLALTALAVGLAPLVARAFHEPELADVLRVLAVSLLIRGVGAAPRMLIERSLAFKSRSVADIAAAGLQAAVAVPLAFAGAGVWSLVAGQLAAVATESAALWAVTPFRPSPFAARFAVLRELARFGRHVTIANLLGLVNSNIDNVVIGRLLGATSLGYYNVAWRVANVPATGLAFIVARVMFPVYATLEGRVEEFRTAFLLNLRRVALVSLPLALGILLSAGPIVDGIFGVRWHVAVPVLRILALFGLARSLAAITGSVFQAAGRPQLVYLIGMLHSIVLYAALFLLAPPFGMQGVAVSMTLAAVSSLVASYVATLRLLDLGLRRVLVALRTASLTGLTVAASLAVVLVATADYAPVAALGVLAAAGTAAYLTSLVAFSRGDLQLIAAAFRPSA